MREMHNPKPMPKNFHIIAVPRREPDLDRIVAALLALALAEVERERAEQAEEARA